MLTVVKVGGGLSREAGDGALRTLCRAIGDAGARHQLLIVPGGGAFADAVRAHDRRFGLRAATAHRMAILAMEQFGWLLADLIPRAVRCADLMRARELAAGHAAVLLPAELALAELPASWGVTSDSIGAWVAGRAGAERLVLVKEVDGLFAGWPPRGEPLPRLTVAELAALRPGGVDAYLPAALERASFETWVITGREPRRLIELLDRGTTVGTRIA
jgi:5-(aminomethyl)-3-furanmethanol phosphate kinase